MKSQRADRITGAQLMAKGLRDLGVSRVFALCGDQVNSIFNAVHEVGIEIVGTRHETAAVHMADGWARATGQLGVAIVTGGPGHTNAITGLTIAYGAKSPVLVISGQAPTDKRDRGGTQTIHQADIAAPVSKWAREVTEVDLVPEYLYRAYVTAMSPTPGPVSLSVPVNVFNGLSSGQNPEFLMKPMSETFAPLQNASCNLDEAAKLVSNATRPICIIGSNANWSPTANDLESFINTLGIPAFTSELARGLVKDDGKFCFGYADPRFNRTFRDAGDADLILLVGATFDFHTLFGKLFTEDAIVVQITDDSSVAGLCRPSDHVLTGDVVEVARSLANKLETPIRSEWQAHLQDRYLAHMKSWEGTIAETLECDDGVHPIQICKSLSRHINDNTGLTFDVGDFVHWPRLYFQAKKRGHFQDASVMGSLGCALPHAIGMQFAFPEDLVIAFMGDGGFGQCSWELSTIVEHNLPIKIVIGNDAAWGVELRLQENDFGKGNSVGCMLQRHRLDQYAEILGAKGLHVSDFNSLDAAIDEMIATDGPCLLDVRIPQRCGRPLSDISIPF